MSKQILDGATYDKILSIHLSGVHDLIAAKGKYHLICYSRFMRSVAETKKGSKDGDFAMTWLCDELQYSADQGQVLALPTVWKRYCSLAEKAKINVPQINRRATFKSSLI